MVAHLSADIAAAEEVLVLVGLCSQHQLVAAELDFIAVIVAGEVLGVGAVQRLAIGRRSDNKTRSRIH